MTNEVQLLGGSFAVDAGKTNALGALTVEKPGTLTVGAGGSLSFASFTPGAGLAPKSIIIDTPMAEGWSYVRIGTSANGLAPEHRQYFRFRDPMNPTVFYRVKQDASGYLYPLIKGTTLIVQ